MSLILRTWLAFAALGAGLIHLALVAGSPLPIAVVLIPLGFAELGWAVLTLRTSRVRSPRTVLLATTLPVVGCAILLSTGSVGQAGAASPSVAALTAACALQLFVASVVAVTLRTGVGLEEAPGIPPAWRYLAGLMLGALAVGAVTTPALASTAAGQHARPHGEHVELPWESHNTH